MSTDSLIIGLKEKLAELSHLKSALEVLHWDQEVFMPKKGATLRSQTMAHLAGLIHERFLAINIDGILDKLSHELDKGGLTNLDQVIVREVRREYERETKLPNQFVKTLAATCSTANAAWVEARKQSDFSLYQPHLESII